MNALKSWVRSHPLRARAKVVARLAAHAGVGRSQVYYWMSGHTAIPATRVPAVCRFTGDAVTPPDLRPDVFGGL